ncbi:MAG TPA: DMT family transporter, partial [Kofleriaceae bacterium]|nr:DMT family transporter [Kofleriaceae bacterium]
TAAALYAGAAIAALLLLGISAVRRAPSAGGSLQRNDLLRIIAIATIGGALAPTLLAWGLQRSGAAVGSLLLNLEAVFTVLLARAFFREPIGRRVAFAVALMALGGAMLSIDAWQSQTWELTGLLAVVAATLAWAADNTLMRPLAERNPLYVVAAKGTIGALLTVVGATLAHEPWPATRALLILLACGATGYGLSLRLYLLAQRNIGAGRTGSIFAMAPFVGAALAFAFGDRAITGWIVAAAGLFVSGVVLHVTEKHRHAHRHDALAHDHMHRHDDEHHTHSHDTPVVGAHSHFHTHHTTEHDHEHAPDVHHDHSH